MTDTLSSTIVTLKTEYMTNNTSHAHIHEFIPSSSSNILSIDKNHLEFQKREYKKLFRMNESDKKEICQLQNQLKEKRKDIKGLLFISFIVF